MAAERLSDIAIQRELGTLPGWSRRGDVITKTFQFRNFLNGIDFVTQVARAAETADHHPDIDIRYTKIVDPEHAPAVESRKRDLDWRGDREVRQ